MPFTSGEILKVFSKKLPQPDQFDNEWRVAIQLKSEKGSTEWYGWGSTKRSGLYSGAAKAAIGEGSKVEFMYDESPNKQDPSKPFKNINKGSMKVIELVDPVPEKEQATSQFTDSGKVPPQVIGQCLNVAIELKLVKSFDDFKDDEKVIKAIKNYKYAKERIEALWDEGQPTKEPKVEPKVEEQEESENHNQQTQHEDQQEVDFDDDIPF